MKTFLIVSFLFLSFDTYAELSCSANGLNILYINGVNVEQNGNNITTSNVQSTLESIASQLDKKQVYPVKGIWNVSRELLNDLEELKAQLAANYQGKKREEFWKALALEKMKTTLDVLLKSHVDAAIMQITKGEEIPIDDNGNIIQDHYTETDWYKFLMIKNSSLANLLANASSDIAVVTEMKNQIKKAYKDGANKVMIVAHSQGNEVLYSAISELRRDASFLKNDAEIKKFDGLLGYIQVAPPSPRLVTVDHYYLDHAQHIRTNVDMVIGLVSYVTDVTPKPANYFYSPFVTGVARFVHAEGWKDSILALNPYHGGEALYHGMDDIYLSDTFHATRDNTNLSKSMKEHFQDNMREIASKLKDNCGVTIESDRIECYHGTMGANYYTYGILSILFKFKGYGTLRGSPESDVYGNFSVSSEDFVSRGVSVEDRYIPSFNVIFLNENNEEVYNKSFSNPCGENGIIEGEDGRFFPF